MVSPAIQQLEDQQVLLTNALRSMLEGAWCGAPPSAAAYISALDPNLQMACTPPVLVSERPPAPPPNVLSDYDPDEYMPPQSQEWTCSACALAWLERALDENQNADESSAVVEIGYPQNINSTYGLMDGSGTRLRQVLADHYAVFTAQGWLTYDQAWSIYSQAPGMMSGGNWYHWVGVRGTSGGDLWVANSAPGYMDVWDIVSRSDFNRLGPFSCVWVTP